MLVWKRNRCACTNDLMLTICFRCVFWYQSLKSLSLPSTALVNTTILYFFAILSILDLRPGVASPGRGSSQSRCLQAGRVTQPLALQYDGPRVRPDSPWRHPVGGLEHPAEMGGTLEAGHASDLVNGILPECVAHQPVARLGQALA